MEVGVGGEVCEVWFVVTGPTLAVPSGLTASCDPQHWVALHFLSFFFFNSCVTAYGLPSLADNSSTFIYFLKPVLKVMYIVTSCLANPDTTICNTKTLMSILGCGYAR